MKKKMSLVIVTLFAFQWFCSAGIIHVPRSQPSIQHGVNAAVNGDVVLVAPGTYMENFTFSGKSITVKSSHGPEVTVIDGGSVGSVVAFDHHETSDAHLEGFTITNGKSFSGSGIYSEDSSPFIAFNIIRGNQSSAFGTVYCEGGSPRIVHNVIINNVVGNSGGGLYFLESKPVVSHNRISRNFAGKNSGGGIHCSDCPAVIIHKNVISHNQCISTGGGVHCEFSESQITENEMFGNSARWGGGLSCNGGSEMTQIVSNRILSNLANKTGAGIYCYFSHPLIKYNEILDNSSGLEGGGVHFTKSSAQFVHNVLYDNFASSRGGGIVCMYATKAVIRENMIIDNSVDEYGGGIACSGDSLPLIDSNVISKNRSGLNGGGIYLDDSTPRIKNNWIEANESTYGGGIHCFDGSSADITNNMIIRNHAHNGSGGGVYCYDSRPDLINNTVLENSADSGGGMASVNYSESDLSNCIFRNNIAATGPQLSVEKGLSSGTVTVLYCNMEGGEAAVFVGQYCTLVWGAGNIDADPMFVDEVNHDYHLTATSPCKDAGAIYPGIEYFDFEGDLRNAYNGPDMGADEFHPHLYFTGNAVPGEWIHAKLIGRPTDLAALFLGSDYTEDPMPTTYGDWFLVPPITMLDLGTFPADGVIVLSSRIPGDLPVGYSLPMQGLVQYMLTNLCVIEIE